MPRSRPDNYKNLPLAFVGCENAVANRTISALHDRTTPVTLRQFLSENANISNKPKMQISRMEAGAVANTIDYNWEDPGNLTQVTEAILNYASVNQQLWPYDVTATVMLRLLGRYKWVSSCGEQKVRVDIITRFFDAVMRTNSLRAANKTVIMSYTEQENLLKEILTKNNVRSEVPIFENKVLRVNQPSATSQSNRQTPFQSSYNKPAADRQKFATFQGLGLCYGWNSLDGKDCINDIRGNRCTDKLKREFVHVCNVWVKTKYCLGSHRRKDHK